MFTTDTWGCLKLKGYTNDLADLSGSLSRMAADTGQL